MTTPRPPSRSPPDATKLKETAARGGSPAGRSKLALPHELHVCQVDLDDVAPVSCLTLDREGRVVEANLPAASAFGVDRRALLGGPFVRLVAPPDADRWQRLMATALRQRSQCRIELTLVCQDGGHFHAEVACQRVARPDTKARLRVTLTDVSLRHLAQRGRRIARSAAVARAAERRAMAIQLHEDLGQRLGMLRMRLGTLALPPECRSARAAVHVMTSEVDRALVLVRRMSADLHPLMLENLGLNAALEWLAGDVASRLGLAVDLHLGKDSVPLDDLLALAIYRLTEMALEHFALHVDAGIDIALLPRTRDLVLQFQSAPGHVHQGANTGAMMNMSEAFRDQVRLLGARLEPGELAEGTRRLSVFIDLEPRRARPAATDSAT